MARGYWHQQGVPTSCYIHHIYQLITEKSAFDKKEDGRTFITFSGTTLESQAHRLVPSTTSVHLFGQDLREATSIQGLAASTATARQIYGSIHLQS